MVLLQSVLRISRDTDSRIMPTEPKNVTSQFFMRASCSPQAFLGTIDTLGSSRIAETLVQYIKIAIWRHTPQICCYTILEFFGPLYDKDPKHKHTHTHTDTHSLSLQTNELHLYMNIFVYSFTYLHVDVYTHRFRYV